MTLRSNKNKALFLDRDGVLIHDPGHLHRLSQIKILPGVELLSRFQSSGYLLIIVSNQSAVARGIISERKMWEIDKYLKAKLRKMAIKITASYYCLHHPDFTGVCECRKPKPKMFLEALKKFNIEKRNSVCIGDKYTDLSAAQTAGIPTTILVKTNGTYWNRQKIALPIKLIKKRTIKQALDHIIKTQNL